MSQLKIKNGNNWESIPAGGIGVPSGGDAGDVLVKSSAVDYATEWAYKGLTLLWSNPSPTNSFSPQTISLDLSKYDGIVLDVIAGNNTSGAPQDGNFHAIFLLLKQTKTNVNAALYGNGKMVARDVNATDTGVTFGDGVFPGTSVDNNKMRPNRIYGIKF